MNARLSIGVLGPRDDEIKGIRGRQRRVRTVHQAICCNIHVDGKSWAYKDEMDVQRVRCGVQTLALVGGTQNEVAGWKIEKDEFMRHSSADAR